MVPSNLSAPESLAFCVSHGVPNPVVPLSAISHWSAVMWSVSDHDKRLHEENAYVAQRCFYAPCEAYPASHLVEQYIAAAAGACWLLIPSISCESIPSNMGIDAIRVPFMSAAFFHVSSTVDEQLRKNIGSSQFRDIRRLTRRAEEACDFRIWTLSDLASSSAEIASFVEIQELNARKYNHPINMYSKEAVVTLMKSPAADRYILKLGARRDNGLVIQASLSHQDCSSGVFTQLVQGIRHDAVPPGLNLYVSDYYQLYKIAEEMGFRRHGLGRGAIKQKRRMGSNGLVRLENVAIPINTKNFDAMAAFAQQAKTVLRDQ